MNVLVTGSAGQLGRCIQDIINKTNVSNCYIFAAHNDLDISNQNDVNKYVSDNDIDVVINCAAYTNVDKAEDNYTDTMIINGYGPLWIAEAMQERNGFVIHISTDYVINSKNINTPISEENTQLHPENNYGKSKLFGEQCIQNKIDKFVILRTSWLYSEYGHNFLKTIYNKLNGNSMMNVVNDQVGTPTYAGDLAQAIVDICEEYCSNPTSFKKFGIYNYSNEGVCSWYDFAQVIRFLNVTNLFINSCHSMEYPSKVKRPSYSVLDKSKIRKTFPNIKIPYWIDSLSKCIKKL